MFQFSLQSLLDHRIRLEEARQKEFSDRKKKYLREEERLARLVWDRSRCSKEFSQKQAEGVLVTESLLYTAYLARLADEIRIQQKAVEQAAAKMEKKRQELVQALKDRKTIEKLKEKKYRDYLRAAKKLEEKLMDEVAVTRFGRAT